MDERDPGTGAEATVQEDKLRFEIEELRQLAEFQERFLASLAHDLQTPPVVIQGMAELLMRGHYGALSGPQDKAVRTVHRNVLLLSQMMEQLLLFSRLLSGRPRAARGALCLRESVRRALGDAQPEWQELNIRCAAELGEEPMHVVADAPSLDFLARNLLLNAGTMLRPGFELRCRVAASGRRAHFTLAIDPVRPGFSQPSRLIQKFFTVPAKGEEEQVPAPPIGLAACSYLARLLGGELALEPDGAAGLRIALALPLAGEGSGGAQRAPRAAEIARRASTPRATAKKVKSRSRR